MTIWHPDTCLCVIEYDDKIQWQKTHQTCEKHKQFSGQKLLDVVLKENREINKIKNKDLPKGILKGTMELIVEETPQNLNLEKLVEAEYNLDKIRHLPMSRPEFRFELSNFLNSAQSIVYHLLEQYNQKFDLGLDYVNTKTFKENAKEKDNRKALDYIRWYQDELNKIKQNKSFGFLIEKRHQNVHKKTIMPKQFKIMSYLSITETEKTKDIPINFNNAEYFFPENPNENLRLVCIKFLNRIKVLVSESESRFPL